MNTIFDFLLAGQFKHKGGGEWAGPCPRCGGEDRFVVWPEHHSGASGGKFLCRGCMPEGGDGIQFLRDFQGMSYPEACEALRVTPRQAHRVQPLAKKTWEPEAARVPSETWQRRAAALLAELTRNLSTEHGQKALEGRSLTIDFAAAHGLGWNPADRYEAPEAWGLEPWENAKGNPGKLYIPAGLVVPTFRKTGPVAVKVRRRDWTPGDKWPKYHALKGGGNGALFLGKSGSPATIVESELDALLIAQEAAGLCSAVALGSVSNRPHIDEAAFLRHAPTILVALDFDKPGATAWRWWCDNFVTARRWPPATGKDPGEMHKAGVPVQAWVEAGLVKPAPPKRLGWKDVCPEYFMGCFECEHYRPSFLRFCLKYTHPEVAACA